MLLALAAPSVAATVPVTPATYAAAMASAAPGDVLQAAPGLYPRLILKGKTSTPPVALVAPETAKFGYLMLVNVNGFRITGGNWADNKVAGTYGMKLSGVANVTIDRALFTNNIKGLIIERSTDVVVTNFECNNSTSDCINVVDSQRVRVTRGLCQGTDPYSGAHPDCVQLWSTGGTITPDTDVTVERVTATGDTQGVTMFVHPDKGQVPGVRIKFLDNYVMGNYPQGVFLGDCTDCTFSGNRGDYGRKAKSMVQVRTSNGPVTGNLSSMKP